MGRLGTRLAALAAVGCGLVVAGCGSTTSGTSNAGVTVTGSTVTIWASQPPGDQGGQAAGDVVDAERMAFAGIGGHVGPLKVRLRIAHDREVSADARAAVSDKTAIAYVGEVAPGTSGVSAQITNELGLLQVSPTDTAAYLTTSVPQVAGSPHHFFPARSTFGSTFARMVPTTTAEAHAVVARMSARGERTLAVGTDSSPYGQSVAAEVVAAARTAGITVSSGSGVGSNAAFFYGGMPSATTARALDAAAASNPHAALYAPSALWDDTFVGQLSAGARSALTVSSPGFTSGQLPASGASFASAFRSKYGHAPAPQAIFGYAAMQAVIATLREAGDHAESRETIVHDFRDLHRPAADSAVGAYVISGGDTDLDAFVFGRWSNGALVAHAAS